MVEKDTQMTDAQRDAELDAMFDSARADPPAVSQALMARVLADAQAAQPRARRDLAGWLSRIGGLPALGGFVTATCVGIWIGVAPPETLPDLGGAVLGVEFTAQADDFADEADGFGWDIEEG